MSIFDVALAPADPILGLTIQFKEDEFPQKMNLGVGAYRTAEGKPYVLDVVKKAEAALQAKLLTGELNKEYCPIDGVPAFKQETVKLILGHDSQAIAEQRVACCQSLSGTGALRIGGMFVAKFLPGRAIFLPSPTWGNHNAIFTQAGLQVQAYRYFDANTKGLNCEGMLEDLTAAPEGSVVLLHACAHNPTGVDPTYEQWEAICKVVEARRLLPFWDSAYQGYASGDLGIDAAPVRLFESKGLEMMIAQSYSKNFGLYGERVGALSIVCGTADAATRTPHR